MRRIVAPCLAAVVLLHGPARAEKKAPPPPLEREHTHPSGAFTFRTPPGWAVQASPANPNFVEAGGGSLLVRFLYRAGEVGYDSLHVDCMAERLAGPMDTHPGVRYEYDFLSGAFGEHRALDSAFVVTYDRPVQGHREWRQRNLTVVGGGLSLCVIGYSPAKVWKKDAAARALLDAVIASVVFRRADPAP